MLSVFYVSIPDSIVVLGMLSYVMSRLGWVHLAMLHFVLLYDVLYMLCCVVLCSMDHILHWNKCLQCGVVWCGVMCCIVVLC